MKEVQGNLVTLIEEEAFDVAIHGCNCFNTMNSGVAASLRSAFPEVYETDLKTIRGDRTKLGTYSTVYLTNGSSILNAYTQYKYSKTKKCVSYEAIFNVFTLIKKELGNLDIRFGIPLIGAGLAGGDWDTIHSIIDPIMEDEDLTLVRFN